MQPPPATKRVHAITPGIVRARNALQSLRRKSRRSAARPALDADQLRRIHRIARYLDSSFHIPGTRIRFGLDSIVGLIPGIGDSVTALASGWILLEAYRMGVRKGTLAKMFGNVAVDAVVGAIPFVGDIFDVYFKANTRNVRLVKKHLAYRSK